jgi:hypothetical protein
MLSKALKACQTETHDWNFNCYGFSIEDIESLGYLH